MRNVSCSMLRFSTATSPKIAFIGLGNMGASMAKNLLKNGNIVAVFDLNPASVAELQKVGATTSVNVKTLAASSDIVVTMLPATAHVKGTLLGPDGIFQNLKKGSLVIDSSTIDPLASRELSEAAKALSLDFVDAPVSGGVTGAAAGTLTFMVGGSEGQVERARPYLAAMGKNIVHCGESGAGGITKLCNNLSLAISMIGTCEAMALGKRLGMDPAKLAGVMNTSTARCWSSDSYNPVPGVMPSVPASRGYVGGFGSALMEKDLGLAMELANKMNARSPLGSSAHQLYGLLCEQGLGDKDFSVVYDFITKQMPKDK
jgi:3-hydroxyisobutyrate dehydrogenase